MTMSVVYSNAFGGFSARTGAGGERVCSGHARLDDRADELGGSSHRPLGILALRRSREPHRHECHSANLFGRDRYFQDVLSKLFYVRLGTCGWTWRGGSPSIHCGRLSRRMVIAAKCLSSQLILQGG